MSTAPVTHSTPNRSWGRLGLATTSLLFVAGCATVENPNPKDPWESYNRTMYDINYHVDNALIKPVANAYKALTPEPARNCLSNMFDNVSDVWSAANSFLQGRPHDFINSLGRVLFNTTMGIGGCFDVASKNGSKRVRNDLGTTLGVWGIGSGPYVVLPILGPSTVRDTAALGGGFMIGFSESSPITSLKNVPVRNTILGLYFVDLRTGLLDAEALVNDIALDRYSFVRDAYLQRRQALVNSKLRSPFDDSYGDDLPVYEDYDDEDFGNEASSATTN